MPESPELRAEFVTQRVLNSAYEDIVAHYLKRQITLMTKVVYAKPASRTYNQPHGTTSIMEELSDPGSGQLVALVHYYLLADGQTIGASGKKDPKRVIWQGVDYRIRTKVSKPHG
jgi:hypothetical protein